MQSNVLSRFLRYVSFDTQSSENTGTHPSTPGQLKLASAAAEDLRSCGIPARITDQAYVYAKIPASPGFESVPALGLIAHLDTSAAAPGQNIHCSVVEWNGGDIPLGNSRHVIRPPDRMKGRHLVVTDGTTLLGADDKAGMAEIVAAAEQIVSGNLPHGPLCIAFTPDEEIGEGADFFDIPGFGADYAYTLDGGGIGGIEFENFNAAKAVIRITGRSTHPGSAKNYMLNAQTVAMEFHHMLPADEVPEHTDGYEGFYHLCSMNGGVNSAELKYIVRTFDAADMGRRKEIIRRIADYLNLKYGENTVQTVLTDQYRNMAEVIRKTPFLLDCAERAIKKAGIEPFFTPVRGGTDGARLSWDGLPCPNLCTGGYSFHGETEYAVVEEMETCVQILLNLVQEFTKMKK